MKKLMLLLVFAIGIGFNSFANDGSSNNSKVNVDPDDLITINIYENIDVDESVLCTASVSGTLPDGTSISITVKAKTCRRALSLASKALEAALE